MAIAVQRVSLRAISTRPSARDLAEFFAALLVLTFVAGAIAFHTGLARWAPLAATQIAILGVRALFVPALGEELVFRAALVPSKDESKRPALWIGVSTLAFTLWHVVETTFLAGSASTFLRPDFLALAFLLGGVCAVLRYRSGSIWTAVLLHWALVVLWQGWFGGPHLLHLA